VGDEAQLGLEEIAITLWLRPRSGGELADERATELGRELPGKRRYLTRRELDERHGPDETNVDALCAVLADYGLQKVWRRWRALRIRGTPSAFLKFAGDAYNGRPALSREANGFGLVREDGLAPAGLVAKTVAAVIGLTPSSTPARRQTTSTRPAAGNAPSPIAAPAIAKHYSLPPGLDGSGETIGIIAFGGTFDRADFEAGMHAAGVTPPQVTSEVIDAPGADDFSDELAIDTQIAGAFAPGARLKLYFAENSKRGWLDALVTALADETDAPSIVSMSYGQGERNFSTAEIACFEEVFIAAALVGMTVIVASGDSGAYDPAGGKLEVNYPASSRFVLACGGTELLDHEGRIANERVWNAAPKIATGGGFSALSDLPVWQRAPLHAALERYRKEYAVSQGRGTPDIVAMASPGFTIVRGGAQTARGGTSAVAPFLAALVARINQRLEGAPAGFFTPLLYERGPEHRLFREIRQGDLPPFHPNGGWDPSVGLGAPKGSELLQLLTS
jgi:kumamolisin